MDQKYDYIDSVVVGNQFSVYTDAEVKQVGVKKVASSVTYDNLNNPVPKFVRVIHALMEE